ncbi:MAG: phosphatidate cytidylyltransferase [Thermodesulfobacteria bacterium]|nr:phosphatidate cytidylyltransferase [Thermodesulfobacteriota bacterium]
MHLYRVLTAIVLLPALLFLLLKGPLLAILLVSGLAALLAWHEYARMATLPFPVFLGGALALVMGFFLLKQGAGLLLLGLWSGLFLFLLYFLRHFEGQKSLFHLLSAMAGFFYVFLGFGHLFLIVTLPQGRLWMLYLLASIFGTDTGAFYAGKTLGRHKLIPRVSPGKTWEGTFGGLFLGILLAVVLGLHFELGKPFHLFLLAGVLSIVGQLGDLLESLLKRGFGVKDSGTLLPGHGGILDRTDALIFAAPLLYWLLHLKGYGQ